MRGIMKYINRINRSTGIVYNQRLREFGINHCQHPYIIQICRHPGISQEELARAICVNKSNVARQLAVLEADGLLTRTPDPEDRRVMQVFPTEKMEALLPCVREVMGDWDSCLLADFSEEDREKLIAMLEIITERAVKAAEETMGKNEKVGEAR